MMLRRLCLVLVVLFVSAAACAPRIKTAVVRDFEPRQVDDIVILPAVDARVDRTIELDFDRQMRSIALALLRQRGYGATFATDATAPTFTDEELRTLSPSVVAGLGLPSSNWVMILTLVELVGFVPFVTPGEAEVQGYLYDKRSGRLVWMDKGFANTSDYGHGIIIDDDDNHALAAALDHLLASIPHRWSGAGRR